MTIREPLPTFAVASPLPPGEYALVWAPDGWGGQLWDFGVDPK
jgi:hypothetical protein